jgi:large subunit ribosomal protein L9
MLFRPKQSPKGQNDLLNGRLLRRHKTGAAARNDILAPRFSKLYGKIAARSVVPFAPYSSCAIVQSFFCQKGLERKMKVLLLKDVYKLGRAGDVKKVADGYGRNFLLPQGMALLATEGALKQSEKIRTEATKKRAALNNEMGSVAEVIKDMKLAFASKAGETGKLYGSITAQDVSDAIKTKTGIEVKRQQIDLQPIRNLGEHKVHIRLTMDLIPEITVVVYREGEANPLEEAAPKAPKAAKPAEAPAEEPVAETEAPAAEA